DQDAALPARHRARVARLRLRRRERTHRRAEDRRLVHGREDQHRRPHHARAAAREDQQGLRPHARGREHPRRGDVLMAGLTLRSESRCFGGRQLFYEHASAVTKTPMRFAVYLPPRAEQERCPALWYLSGLTCTEENVVTKAGFQRRAAERGLIVIAPDTSPRGAGVEGEDVDWDFGTGAGFYVDATQDPWATNYRMWSYVTEELPALAVRELPILEERQGITGHSMGGHSALVV